MANQKKEQEPLYPCDFPDCYAQWQFVQHERQQNKPPRIVKRRCKKHWPEP